ncbi:hypothetical protein FOVSG1_003859 [Fusarium oxysporum f. sp. vasinfectum]
MAQIRILGGHVVAAVLKLHSNSHTYRLALVTHRENIRNEGRRDIICTVTQPQLGAHKPTLSAASSLDPFQLEN